MKIGLWSDCHNFPSLPIMKLSAWHKAQGDTVEMLNHWVHYDRVYCSKTFDFTPDAEDEAVIRADEIIRAGTGYHDYTTVLPNEVEHIYPDYSLYPQYKYAVGFLTRGCPRNCGFCIVSRKEGRVSRKNADLAEFWRGQREIKLLDPNLLACKEHEGLLQQLIDSKAWVDFTQGLDIRLTNPDNIGLLNRIKTKMLHFAWDDPEQDLTEYFEKFNRLSNCNDYRKKRVYVLTNYGSTHEQDLYRIYTLRSLDYDPYVMIYNKGEFVNPKTNRMYPMRALLKKFSMEQIEHFKIVWKIQRWVNNKFIFRSCERFEDYMKAGVIK